MSKLKVYTKAKNISADLTTPISLFLKIKEQYQFPILLESTEYGLKQNSKSIISFMPLAYTQMYFAHQLFFINNKTIKKFGNEKNIFNVLSNFINTFEFVDNENSQLICHYYPDKMDTPQHLAFFGLYQYSLIFNHYTDEIKLIGMAYSQAEAENAVEKIQAIINQLNPTDTYFIRVGEAHTLIDKQTEYKTIKQKFKGDDFYLYRAIRHCMPSPYLYYLDFGKFRILGSYLENSTHTTHRIQKTKLKINELITHSQPFVGFKNIGGDENYALIKEYIFSIADDLLIKDMNDKTNSKLLENVNYATQKFEHLI